MKLHYTEMEQDKEFELPAGPFTVGRNKVCGLPIRDLSISKQHCECKIENGKLMIRDIGSRNGTWINGDRVGDAFAAVALSDQLIIGKLEVKLTSGDTVGEMAPVGVSTEEDESEGTVFDADFGSSAAWGNNQEEPAGGQGPEAQKWNQSVEVAAEMSSGDYSNMLRGEIHEPGLPPTRLMLNPGTHLIGSDLNCSVRLGAGGVSTQHAQFEHDAGQWWVKDLGSRNGTYVNKQSVSDSQRAGIKPGDELFFGPVKVVVAQAVASSRVAAAVGGPAIASTGGGEGPAEGKKGPNKVLIAVGAVFGLLLILGVGVKMFKGGGSTENGSNRPDNPADNSTGFKNNLDLSIKRMNNKEWREALTFLGVCNTIYPGEEVIQTMVKVCGWLSEQPTNHIEDLITAGDYLSRQKNDVLVSVGVPDFGKALHQTWVLERGNATNAKKGEEAYDREDWLKACSFFDKIKKRSPFFTATRLKKHNAKTKICLQLIEEGDKALKRGDADLALQKYDQALKYALDAGQQIKIHKKKQLVLKNLASARLLNEAKEAYNSGSYEACIEKCDKIKQTSTYFREASELREKAQAILTEREAIRLYGKGDGPKAIKMLTSYTSLKALREKMQQVVQLYEKANKLYEQKNYEQANPIWESLVAIESNPQNWYVLQAVNKKRVDPTKLAQALAEKAKRLYASNKKIEAAKKCFDALGFDIKNATATKMKKSMVREINLKFSILRQQWQDKKVENLTFIKKATFWRDYLKAVDPVNNLLPKMEEDLARAK